MTATVPGGHVTKPETSDQPITFLLSLDMLDRGAAGFLWGGKPPTRDQFERGEDARRVAVQVPRDEWEKAGRPTVVTLTLAHLTTP